MQKAGRSRLPPAAHEPSDLLDEQRCPFVDAAEVSRAPLEVLAEHSVDVGRARPRAHRAGRRVAPRSWPEVSRSRSTGPHRPCRSSSAGRHYHGGALDHAISGRPSRGLDDPVPEAGGFHDGLDAHADRVGRRRARDRIGRRLPRLAHVLRKLDPPLGVPHPHRVRASGARRRLGTARRRARRRRHRRAGARPPGPAEPTPRARRGAWPSRSCRCSACRARSAGRS